MKASLSRPEAFLAFVLFSLAQLFLITGCQQVVETRQEKIKLKTDQLSSQELGSLGSGDIICRKGFGLVSDVISGFASKESTISHCGILLKRESGWVVMQSMSPSFSEYDGVHIVSLGDFLKRSRDGSTQAYRVKTDDWKLKSFILKADSISTEEIPFDQDFDLADSKKLYCTELIQVLLREAEIEIQLDYREFEDRMVLTFHSLEESEEFQKVCCE